MRQPTTKAASLAWWHAALRDPATPRHEEDPQCGWFKYRAVSGGPFLPVRIWLDQEIDPETGELMGDEAMRCECLGNARNPVWIWTHLRPITLAEYDALVTLHNELDLMAATHAPIDITKVKHTKPKNWSI